MRKPIVALLVLTVLFSLFAENDSWRVRRVFRRVGRFVRRVVRHVKPFIPRACRWICRLAHYSRTFRAACYACKIRSKYGKRELSEIDMQEILKTVPEEHKAVALRSMKDPQADTDDVDEGYSEDVGEKGYDDEIDSEDLLQRTLEDADDENDEVAQSNDDEQLEKALMEN